MTSCFTLRHALLVTMSAGAVLLYAQQPSMIVYGTVRDMATRDSIPYPNVSVQEVGLDLPAMPIVSTARGRYEVELTPEKVYLIRFGAPGKVGKSLQIDLRGASPEQWEGGFGMNIDATVLDSIPGVDFSILEEPFGKARFEPSTGNFEWDIEYTRSLRDRQAALLEEYERRKKTVPSKQ